MTDRPITSCLTRSGWASRERDELLAQAAGSAPGAEDAGRRRGRLAAAAVPGLQRHALRDEGVGRALAEHDLHPHRAGRTSRRGQDLVAVDPAAEHQRQLLGRQLSRVGDRAATGA